jgi:hypothetical protein
MMAPDLLELLARQRHEDLLREAARARAAPRPPLLGGVLAALTRRRAPRPGARRAVATRSSTARA